MSITGQIFISDHTCFKQSCTIKVGNREPHHLAMQQCCSLIDLKESSVPSYSIGTVSVLNKAHVLPYIFFQGVQFEKLLPLYLAIS